MFSCRSVCCLFEVKCLTNAFASQIHPGLFDKEFREGRAVGFDSGRGMMFRWGRKSKTCTWERPHDSNYKELVAFHVQLSATLPCLSMTEGKPARYALQRKPVPSKKASATQGIEWLNQWRNMDTEAFALIRTGLIVTFNTDWSRKHIQVPKICGDNSETCSGPNCFSSAFEGFLSRYFWVYVIKMTKDWSLLDCQVHEVVHHFSLVVYKSPKSP